MLLAQRVFVAHDDRRWQLDEKRQQPVFGVAAQDKADASREQTVGEIGEPLDEKLVVPKIGARDEGIEAEERNDGLTEEITELNRRVERGLSTAR